MIKCFRDSIRMSQNIARQLGVECPIKILYVDSILDNLVRVKNSLCLLRDRAYKVDTIFTPGEAMKLVGGNSYDALLINEKLHVDQDECPVIVVPNYVLNLNSKWKLAYTLDELIHELLAVSHHKHLEQQTALA